VNKKQQKTWLIWVLLVSPPPTQFSENFYGRFFKAAAS
jgi:hypothetical protein